MAKPGLNVLQGPTIDAGTAESNVLGVGTDFVVGLIAPDDWTPAVVSVMLSPQGDNYYDVFDITGRELVFNITPGAMIQINPDSLLPAAYLRLRSGTRDKPVNQTAMRRFQTICIASVSSAAEITLGSKLENTPSPQD
jgi:hypothetical protein